MPSARLAAAATPGHRYGSCGAAALSECDLQKGWKAAAATQREQSASVVSSEKPQTSAPARLAPANSAEFIMPETDRPRSRHVAALSPVQWDAKAPMPRKEERARTKGRGVAGGGGGGEREREGGDDDDGAATVPPGLSSSFLFFFARSSVKTLTSACLVADASACP